ncbi:MAG TPA: hypothetical protein VMI33_20405 [Streptosporangiaceae bacterium]|nr:hypothetical protein [Streptosporangiaceae bacterium]
MADDTTAKGDPPAWRESLAGAVAVSALVAFLVLVALMFLLRGGSETVWSRLVYLLTGVEAVAFAGAGWLFGKEVHRSEAQHAQEQVATEQQRADRADTAAREAADKADEARDEAEAQRLRGSQLALAAVAEERSRPPARRGIEREAAGGSGSAGDAASAVADLARRLYPELFPD